MYTIWNFYYLLITIIIIYIAPLYQYWILWKWNMLNMIKKKNVSLENNISFYCFILLLRILNTLWHSFVIYPS